MQGIYKITNKENGKVYIGKSTNLDSRLYGHLSRLRNHHHPNLPLQADFDQYGKDAFDFEIIEETEDLDNREKYWIEQHYPDCYNNHHHYPTTTSKMDKMPSLIRRIKRRSIAGTSD